MSEDLVNIEVNGQALQARRGQMLIQATDAAGIYVPRFCYHEKLSVGLSATGWPHKGDHLAWLNLQGDR